MKTVPLDVTDALLIEDCESLHEYVITFMAILDMAKDHYLVFTIDDQDNIWFRRGSNHE